MHIFKKVNFAHFRIDKKKINSKRTLFSLMIRRSMNMLFIRTSVAVFKGTKRNRTQNDKNFDMLYMKTHEQVKSVELQTGSLYI